ncbi:efflux RND transporter permease subunit [Chloroflexales bacterium ZM16-3]|nr:efflux RND transporter permease subunit [Chloroflexales bacterium ZM16-3]
MAPRRREKLHGLAISDVAINQPVFITMIMLAVITFGILAFNTTPVNLLPDIDVPVVAVTISYSGAGPESVADQVVKPIEDAVNTLEGLEHITSQASDGFGLIILSFKSGTDINQADQDVREKVNGVMPSLPQDVRDPVFQRFDPNAAPIMEVAVSGNAGQTPLELRTDIENNIVPLLQRAGGVGNITINGGQVRQINVLMDLSKLQAYGILPSQITRSLQQANATLGLGTITQGNQEIGLRAPSLLQTPDDIGRIQITGTSYRVSDVATIEDGVADNTSYSRLNGDSAIILSILKQSGANTVQVADNVRATLTKTFDARPDLAYEIPVDDSTSVRASVNSSLQELGFAALAAFLVVWLFFGNLRSTIITMVGLPVILIGTFIFMPLFGITINLISLLALSLCVGLVIDDAIVVRENIFRHLERGDSSRVASSKGTWEVGLSVLAMTLTIVAVFVPVTFAEGTAGIVFRSFGLIVAIAILLSLVEAFTFAPMMSANLFPNIKPKAKKHSTVHRDMMPDLKIAADAELNERDAGLIEEAHEDPGRMGIFYGKLLAWSLSSLRNRMFIVAIAIGVLLLSGVVASGLKFSFFPTQDNHQFIMGFELPPGTALVETDRLAQEAEAVLKADPAVLTAISTVGFTGAPERAEFSIKIDSHIPSLTVQERLRSQLKDLPRLSFAVPSFSGGSTGVSGRELQVSLQSTRPLADMAPVVTAVRDTLGQVDGLVDIDTNYTTGKPELRFNADPGRIGDLGITNDDISASVRALINGSRATVLRQNGVDTDVVVRLRPDDRSSVQALSSITIPTRSGVVPLSSLGTVSLDSSPTTIRRYDRLNQLLVGANLEGRNLTDVSNELQPKINALGIPADIVVSYQGTLQQTSEGFGSLILAMALSVLFVYMVLASQFGSFTQPLVIMMAMPFSFIGAFLALRIVGIDLDITGMIGLIMLLGVVVKNSILLVDFTNRLRRVGLEKHQALRLAGAIRLRPILMTSVALIAGALPTAFGIHFFGSGEGSEFRRGLAWVIVGGVTTSTLLTLLVVPTVYSLLDSAVSRFMGLFRQGDSAQPEAPAAQPEAPVAQPEAPAAQTSTHAGEAAGD